jgi:3-phosphoshikimate 1-carboxyvinyltransferase
MRYVRITKAPDVFEGEVILPASKSISNRLLIIRALSGSDFMISNLSNADDTILMYRALNSAEDEVYIRNAGTAMRFLTAYFACSNKDVVLQGDERMSQRPIAPLVDALRQAGAEIYYLGQEGYPPLQISGKPLKGGRISVDASLSSQYISALLMIAPVMEKGLELMIEGQSVSRPYVDMTLELMRLYGIQFSIEENKISVPRQFYRPINIRVESDWSAASYWYALAAIRPGSRIIFPDLHEKSMQGDSRLAHWMRQFGVESEFKSHKVAISSSGNYPNYFEADMKDTPDLVMTFVSLCVKLKIKFRLSGIAGLQHKESNRGAVLETEMKKLGAHITWSGDEISCEQYNEVPAGPIILNTYDDHRMAMSWVLHALDNPAVSIENPDCVQKSYPDFWNELERIGVGLKVKESR